MTLLQHLLTEPHQGLKDHLLLMARQADPNLLRRAARTREAGVLPYVYLGHAYQQRGRDADAAAAYRKARDLDPADAHPLFALGDLHNLSGRTAEAAARVHGALDLPPGPALDLIP